MSAEIYELTYESKKDFLKVLPNAILTTLENNDIVINNIFIKGDSGSETVIVSLEYFKLEFKITYELPGPGFIKELIEYIDDLEFDINDESYLVDSTFDKDFLTALQTVVKELNM